MNVADRSEEEEPHRSGRRVLPVEYDADAGVPEEDDGGSLSSSGAHRSSVSSAANDRESDAPNLGGESVLSSKGGDDSERSEAMDGAQPEEDADAASKDCDIVTMMPKTSRNVYEGQVLTGHAALFLGKHHEKLEELEERRKRAIELIQFGMAQHASFAETGGSTIDPKFILERINGAKQSLIK